MLNYIHGTLPNKENEFGFAFSAGVDSVVFTNYLLKTGRQFKLYFFHHGDEDDNRALAFTKQYAKENNLEVVTNQNVVYHGSSDEVMRNARYEWLDNYKDIPVLTGHNLEDIVSGYVMFWIKGQEKFIPVTRNHVVRPFLLTRKKDIIKYAQDNCLQWYESPGNSTMQYDRNKVNKIILPEINKINPGFDKKIKNLFLEKLRKEGYKV